MMRKGPLAWMVDHGVAPNLMMVLFIVGGLMASLAIKKEVFPEFETEIVQVTISYPGATPEDVEQSLLLPVEAAIADVEGIDELTASASEGSGVVSATLIDGVDVMRAYQDIQQSVNAITTLPAAADPPRFTLAGRSRSVVSLQVYGNVGLAALHDAAENVRAELQATSGISRAELSGNKKPASQGDAGFFVSRFRRPSGVGDDPAQQWSGHAGRVADLAPAVEACERIAGAGPGHVERSAAPLRKAQDLGPDRVDQAR